MRAFVKGKLFFAQTLFHLYKHKITVKQDYFSIVNKLLLIAGLLEIRTPGTNALQSADLEVSGKTESRSIMRVDYYGLDLTLL